MNTITSLEACAEATAPLAATEPLVVDLDRTLVRADLLAQSALECAGAGPARILLLRLLSLGKAAVKDGIAAGTSIAASTLPYEERVLELIRDARREGRRVYIASANNERYVADVAEHVGADGWFASCTAPNLSADAKAQLLVEAFGEKGFDYAGSGQADLPVWEVCRRGWALDPTRGLREALAARGSHVTIVAPTKGSMKPWLKLIRVHQWAKNILIFVPLITAQQFGPASLALAVAAFLAFSFAASAAYIVNDIADLEADRQHPSKKRRPLAAGSVPITAAIPVSLALLFTAMALALALGPLFAGVLFVYISLTTAYTFFLKRKMLVDIVTLAALYTLRVIGGAAAISVPVSEWLLAFSMMIFTSLALLKRYVELASLLDAGLPDPSNREYRKSDLDLVAALAAAAGFNAVTVFALYVSSDTVRQLYDRPQALWLVCPLLMYWLGRTLMLARRRMLHDDPIQFALKDRTSLVCGALIALIVVGAA
ncbi:UbiA family prenyltransferase [Ramlibacter sp. AN1015]|uniref:UbiA family prenyltransferase n=1 Tax=Ramlibacter sp. AN1015 TaxID=3133428 RepID=UPI0030C381D6